MKINIRNMKKSGKLPYGKNVSVSFEENYCIEATEIGEIRINYTSFERLEIVEKAIYIYYSTSQAIIIPFSVFNDEIHRNDFLSFLREKTIKNV